MYRLDCISYTVPFDQNTATIFVGHMPANEVAILAAAPSFTNTTKHSDIAKNANPKLIEQWQRPIITTKRDAIAALFNSGDLMPNPVLLSENPHVSGAINISPKIINGIAIPNLHEITIVPPNADEEKPLWILDGQHRIAGLNQSLRKHDSIPLVLLLNQGFSYPADVLAKIFTQVTTTATGLKPIHEEWLTFTFGMGKYNPRDKKSDYNCAAMATVISLTTERHFPRNSQSANPFDNRITFNPETPVSNAKFPFNYSCDSLQDLFAEYFKTAPALGVARLQPVELAEQVALAYNALVALTLRKPERNVFLHGKTHRVMQDAYVIGVLSYLLTHAPPPHWKHVLTSLRFDTTNWDFTWAGSMSGPEINQRSNQIARQTFTDAFSKLALPNNIDLSNHLYGVGAWLEFEAYKLDSAGTRIMGTEITYQVSGQKSPVWNIDSRRGLRIRKKSANILDCKIVEDPPQHFAEDLDDLIESADGLTIVTNKKKQLVKYFIRAFHYSDKYTDFTLEIQC